MALQGGMGGEKWPWTGRRGGLESHFEVSGQTFRPICTLLEIHGKPKEKIMFIEGWRGSGRPNRSHLGPKVAPTRGQGSQNNLEEGRQRARTAKIEQVKSTCLSELWESMETSRKSDQAGSKNYLSDKSYD